MVKKILFPITAAALSYDILRNFIYIPQERVNLLIRYSSTQKVNPTLIQDFNSINKVSRLENKINRFYK